MAHARLRIAGCLLPVACCLLLFTACDDLSGPWVGGIGAVLRHRARQGTLVVTDVPPRSNAAEAGLRPGDRIVAIDRTPVTGMPPRQIVEHLRGPVGSFVTLTIERGGSTRHLRVERAPYAARD